MSSSSSIRSISAWTHPAPAPAGHAGCPRRRAARRGCRGTTVTSAVSRSACRSTGELVLPRSWRGVVGGAAAEQRQREPSRLLRTPAAEEPGISALHGPQPGSEDERHRQPPGGQLGERERLPSRSKTKDERRRQASHAADRSPALARFPRPASRDAGGSCAPPRRTSIASRRVSSRPFCCRTPTKPSRKPIMQASRTAPVIAAVAVASSRQPAIARAGAAVALEHDKSATAGERAVRARACANYRRRVQLAKAVTVSRVARQHTATTTNTSSKSSAPSAPNHAEPLTIKRRARARASSAKAQQRRLRRRAVAARTPPPLGAIQQVGELRRTGDSEHDRQQAPPEEKRDSHGCGGR